MSFEPKIIAYVCNWCTYLGADLAGTNRLAYPPNVRIIRLPCTGRIDFNLIIKAFEVGADSVLVSGCHPGDCHYSAGNYHARRRWMLFRPLLETLGFDLRRIQFTWISAAEGRKFQQTITEFTALTRELGPANYLKTSGAAPELERSKPPRPQYAENAELKVRQRARELLASGQVAVVVGYDRRGTPLFVTDPAGAGALAVNENCHANLAVYVKRKEVRALGPAAILCLPATARALNVLEQEAQVDRSRIVEIPVAGPGAAPSFQDLDALLSHEPEARMAYWADEFDRCVKCYACRQVCPMCYCEQCLVEKNRPQVIDSSPTLMGNFAWHITRAFHLASRCVGCGECTRACPAGINLTLLNKTLAKASFDHFGYRAGADRGAQPLIGIYSLQDKEDFIR
jgi:coenzyme F420-reducing hydrogenase delta subunit/ferredoxin